MTKGARHSVGRCGLCLDTLGSRVRPPIYDHVGFAFDGGVGIVMAMRKPKDSDPLMVDAEPAATVAA